MNQWGPVLITIVTVIGTIWLMSQGKTDLAAVGSILGFALAVTTQMLKESHQLMNSRLTELLEARTNLSHAEGLAEGKSQGEATGRADQHTSEGGGTLK